MVQLKDGICDGREGGRRRKKEASDHVLPMMPMGFLQTQYRCCFATGDIDGGDRLEYLLHREIFY